MSIWRETTREKVFPSDSPFSKIHKQKSMTSSFKATPYEIVNNYFEAGHLRVAKFPHEIIHNHVLPNNLTTEIVSFKSLCACNACIQLA